MLTAPGCQGLPSKHQPEKVFSIHSVWYGAGYTNSLQLLKSPLLPADQAAIHTHSSPSQTQHRPQDQSLEHRWKVSALQAFLCKGKSPMALQSLSPCSRAPSSANGSQEILSVLILFYFFPFFHAFGLFFFKFQEVWRKISGQLNSNIINGFGSSAKESRRKRMAEKQQFPKNCLSNPLPSQKTSAKHSLCKSSFHIFCDVSSISLCLAAAQVQTMLHGGVHLPTSSGEAHPKFLKQEEAWESPMMPGKLLGISC